MSARVIPFRDPYAPLEGEAREPALPIYREVLKATARDAVSRGFTQAIRLPECRRLGISDVALLFVETMRCDLGLLLGIPPDPEDPY